VSTQSVYLCGPLLSQAVSFQLLIDIILQLQCFCRCAKLSDIRLDINKIKDMIEPILGKLVNTREDGAFDKVAVPLLELDKRLPGISDLAGKTITFLDIAESLVGKQSGVDTVRTVINIYKAMKALAEIFAEANADGILLAEYCRFKPSQAMVCVGGVM
jgi:hypothetical protein